MLEGWAQLANAAVNIKHSPGAATEQLVSAVNMIEQLSGPLFCAFIFAHLDISSADAHHVLEGMTSAHARERECKREYKREREKIERKSVSEFKATL